MCKSKNIHTYIHLYPTDDHWELHGGWGYQSLKYLMQCVKLNWKLWEVEESKPKSNPMREGGKGMDIFVP